MPFSSDQFFQVIQNYNLAVGNSIWLLYGATLFTISLLFTERPKKNQAALTLLSFLWFWMGIIYHWIYFSEINPAARIFGGFFVLQAIFFAFAAWSHWTLTISPVRTPKGMFQLFLILYALIIYPLIGSLSGHGYPYGPIFGLPCPTTIFTFALLIGLEMKLSKILFLSFIPVLWAIIGTSAAKYFGVTEDYMLGVSAGAFIVLQLLSKLKSQRKVKQLMLN